MMSAQGASSLMTQKLSTAEGGDFTKLLRP